MKRIMKVISVAMIALVCSAAAMAVAQYTAKGNFPTPPGYGDWDDADPDIVWAVWDEFLGTITPEVSPRPEDIALLGYSQNFGNHWLVVEADTIANIDLLYAGTLFDETNPTGGTVYTQGLKIYGKLDLNNPGGNGHNGLWYSGAYNVNDHAGGSLIRVYDGAFFDAGKVVVYNAQASAVNTIEQLGGEVTLNNITINGSLFEYQLKGGTLTHTGSTQGGVSGLSTSSKQMALNIAGGTLVIQDGLFTEILKPQFARRVQAYGVNILTHVTDVDTRDLLLEETAIDGGFVVVRALHPTKTANPIPTNLGKISRESDVSWTVSLASRPAPDNDPNWFHQVYFDTVPTFANVTAPIVIDPSLDKRLSVANALLGGPLTPGTYYWRVDAVEPNFVAPFTPTIYPGDVWSFEAITVPTLIAPADTYTPAVDIDVNLEWSSEAIVAASKIIITPAGEAPIDLGVQTSPFNPFADAGIEMQWNKQYTWQVIDLDGGNNVIGESPQWKFAVRALDCTVIGDIDGSGDCVVDLADFAVLAAQWLDCGWDDGGRKSPCPEY